jgi:2-polyprenyl-3-methyl-5-hydroxy-6-metoxy-1,4-benzoquinol methylase
MSKFINKEIKVFDGIEAEKFLKEKNDSQFIQNGNILKVSKDRWLEAQYYERKTWCEDGKFLKNDRNDEHEKIFGYNNINLYLQNESISICELGCGPFSNVRLLKNYILKKIDKIDLLDPLINEYKKYNLNCTYKNNILNGHNVNTINLPIEQFNPIEQYDLVIMINVLEHCYNTDLIFNNIYNMLKPNGIFYLHDTIYEDDKIESKVNNNYDAGHPIHISKSKFYEYLKSYKKLFRNSFIGDQNTIKEYLILKK